LFCLKEKEKQKECEPEPEKYLELKKKARAEEARRFLLVPRKSEVARMSRALNVCCSELLEEEEVVVAEKERELGLKASFTIWRRPNRTRHLGLAVADSRLQLQARRWRMPSLALVLGTCISLSFSNYLYVFLGCPSSSLIIIFFWEKLKIGCKASNSFNIYFSKFQI
jgi:hypothetical protein